MTTATPVPILRYLFNTWTTGQTTVTNKGSLGTSSVYNATIYGNANVISSLYAAGTQCLSIVGI